MNRLKRWLRKRARERRQEEEMVCREEEMIVKWRELELRLQYTRYWDELRAHIATDYLQKRATDQRYVV